MNNIKINSVDFIKKLSYPDFIGLINQWNTPPGAYSTISKLAIFSSMNNKSNLLEVGCSTGFSSIEFSVLTGCYGTGIDSSKNSITMANYNKKKYTPNINIAYKFIDGYNYFPDKKFSHIMVGGNLKFFNDPENMLLKCLDMLNDGGYILATPYYEIKKIPNNISNKVNKILGIPISAFSNFSYKDIMKMYNKLEIVFEERNILTQETEEEIEYYCKSIISMACKIHSITNKEIYNIMYKRILNIRKLINSTRKFQEYAILVLRYRKSVYPNRYTPLF